MVGVGGIIPHLSNTDSRQGENHCFWLLCLPMPVMRDFPGAATTSGLLGFLSSFKSEFKKGFPFTSLSKQTLSI